MILPKKLEVKKTYLIVYFSDGSVKYVDMLDYLKVWATQDAKRLLQNITTDLSAAYLEDGYAISWPSYNLSIDPETFYADAISGYPTQISAKSFLAKVKSKS